MANPLASIGAVKRKSVVAARKVGAAARRASTPAPPKTSLTQLAGPPADGGVKSQINLRQLPPQLEAGLARQAGITPPLGPQAPGVVRPDVPMPPIAAPSVHVHVHLPRRGR